MKNKKVVETFRTTIEQKNTLKRLGLKRSQFIRDAINEKLATIKEILTVQKEVDSFEIELNKCIEKINK